MQFVLYNVRIRFKSQFLVKCMCVFVRDRESMYSNGEDILTIHWFKCVLLKACFFMCVVRPSISIRLVKFMFSKYAQ